MKGGDDRIDPAHRLFFVSYARPRLRNLTKEHRFYKDLCEDVGELQGRDAGEYPGFMDLDMKPGTTWPSELLEAVGSCQVLLPLLSKSLVGSDWCGKEWHAFSMREVQLRRDSPEKPSRYHSAILPVLWTAVTKKRLPKAITRIQLFSPDDPALAELYLKHGIYGLLNYDERTYRKVVWELAQEINLVLETYHVVRAIPEVDALLNIFAETPGPGEPPK